MRDWSALTSSGESVNHKMMEANAEDLYEYLRLAYLFIRTSPGKDETVDTLLVRPIRELLERCGYSEEEK